MLKKKNFDHFSYLLFGCQREKEDVVCRAAPHEEQNKICRLLLFALVSVATLATTKLIIGFE